MPTHCERGCRRHTVTHWWHDGRDDDLWLCGPDSDMHAEALVAQGWQLLWDQRVEDIHPSLGPVTADPATH